MAGTKTRVAIAALTVSAALLGGMQVKEGKSNDAYIDQLAVTKVVTICYGDTAGWRLGDHLSDQQCDALLKHKLDTVYAPIVRKYVTVPLTQGEFDALVDFVYNLGEGNFRTSTLLRKVNAGDSAGASAEFIRWYKTNGKDCRIRANRCYGIIERRVWETQLFVS